MKYFLLFLLSFSALFAQNGDWGWEAHRYINEHAVDYLPQGMSFFQDHRAYLRQHSVDPDSDPNPGFYHYIDIDDYPGFFNGTLTHNLNQLIATYGINRVEDNGIVPWIVEEWSDSLTTLMAGGQWDQVWQIAAELGHYVADSHQALHLTLNYNGQLTGNYGIHSRYETQMINPHLPQLPLPAGAGEYWPNPIDSVFAYIDDIYPHVNQIMLADDAAYAQDPGYGAVYYNSMWQQLEQITVYSIHRSILDLASVWRTAWENAGSPSPYTNLSETEMMGDYILSEAYPNPFNPLTNIQITMPRGEEISLKIYDVTGGTVATLFSGILAPGVYTYPWNAANIASGVYFYRLQTASGFNRTQRLILLQ